jgi:hypothetical protein
MPTLRFWEKTQFNKVQILLKLEITDLHKHTPKIGIEK